MEVEDSIVNVGSGNVIGEGDPKQGEKQIGDQPVTMARNSKLNLGTGNKIGEGTAKKCGGRCRE